MTRRVQFARSSVTGNIPSSLQPGTPAFNWTDGKMYVGTAGGSAQLISQMIDDHDIALIYRAGDFVVYENDLYRALVDIPANVGFRPSEWLQMTDLGSGDSSLRSASGVLSGGTVSAAGATISVAAGTGLVVNRRDPSALVVTFVEWAAFSFAAPHQGSGVAFTLYIGGDGSATLTTGDSPLLVREGVRLAQGLWSDVSGDIHQIWDARIWAGRSPDESTELLTDLLYPAVADGLRVSANADLTVELKGGSLFSPGIGASIDPARKYISGATPATFTVVTRAGNNYASVDVTDVPLEFDGGAGPTPLPSGAYTIHLLKASLSGDLYLELGQATYAGVTEAINAVSIYVREVAIEVLPDSASAILAAIIVTDTTADLTDPSTGRVIPAVYPSQRFAQASETDSSAFYLLDGSRSLTGDMNAGGNAITSAIIDGEANNVIKTKDEDVTGVLPLLEEREIGTHVLDKKLVSGTTTIADRIELHDPARSYLTGDACYESGVLYLAEADIPPEPFDPSNWTAIGASGGDLTDAVILAPQAAGRNTVDLGGVPAVEGLIINPDASQTAPVADLGGAVVDRYGMPGGNFGYIVRRVAQATHSFTAVGEAVAFDNPNWVPADASDPDLSGKALGVVKEVIDANNFVLQLGGTVSDLSTAAFEGGVITAGAAYYVSATNAGKLTSTAPAAPDRVDPVLVTTTATEGIIALSSAGDVELGGGGQTFFTVAQPAHGFTVIGSPLYMNAGVWALAQGNDVATMAVGILQEVTDANNFIVNVSGLIENLNPAAFEGAVAPTAGTFYYVSQGTAGILTEIAPVDREGLNRILLAMSATTGVVLQDRGDWIPVTQRGGKMINGYLDITQSTFNQPFLGMRSTGVTGEWAFLQGSGGALNITDTVSGVNFNFAASTTLPAAVDDAVLRRGWADELYLSLDGGGTVVGDINVTGAFNVVGDAYFEGMFDIVGDATIDGTLLTSGTIGVDGPENAFVFENDTDANASPHVLQAASDGNIKIGHGTDNVIAGIIEPALMSASFDQTLMTRFKADERYAQINTGTGSLVAAVVVDGPTGDILSGFGMTCTKTSNNFFDMAFDVALPDNNYHVDAQMYATNSVREFLRIAERLTTGFGLNYADLNGNGFQPQSVTIMVYRI